MAEIFTIYCHGTGMNRDKKQDIEIVNFFGNNGDVDTDAQLMLDGVGSKPTNHPMAGNFIFEEAAPFHKRDISQDKSFLKTNPLAAQISGHGVAGNISFALAYLGELVKPLPRTINMIGWSRGAVTAIRLANAISKHFPKIEMNIFAVDPVAGNDKGEENLKAQLIPIQVKNFVAILATDEKRATFSPQDAARLQATPATNTVLLPMPGAHDTVAMWNTQTLHISEVVFSLAGQFLLKFGTRPRQVKGMLNDHQYVERYSHMLLNLDQYKALKGGKFNGTTLKNFVAAKGKVVERTFNENMDEYVVNPERFINLHHRRCFRASYPNLFGYLFKSEGSQINESQVEPEYNRVDPSTREVIQKLAKEQMDQRGEAGGVLQLHRGNFPKGRALKLKYRGSLHQMGLMNAEDKKQED